MALLLGDAFAPSRRRLWLGAASALVLAAAACVVRSLDQTGVVLGMMAVDGLGHFFRLTLLGGVLLVLWMSSDYGAFAKARIGWGTYAALLLFSAAGLLFLVASMDLLMVVISLELISVTSFILTGFQRRERRSTEAAIKFFLVGAFSSGIMIYGISLLYGLLGSTSLQALADADLLGLPRFPLVGSLLFILAGLGFKLGMAPFHMWIPDAYEGAPTPVTAFLSVAPKAAAVGVLVRALSNHAELDLTGVLAVLAALTMTLGNLSALRQTNVKRLMAYSSIAQVGYILVGFVAAGKLGMLSVLVYTLAYLFMNLGAFACVIAVTDEAGTDEIEGFAGLSRRSLPLALATTVFLLSLTGIPPLIGFVGKFAIFAAAVAEGWIWLAVAGVLNSVVSLYYYFLIAHRMFFTEPARSGPVRLTPALAACVALTLFVTLAVGLFPNALLAWALGVVPQ
jgi:NADH-quinone oxidoreductase subunit N